ncbi:transcriptional regulator, MarR family [Desulfosarcina variabilis str. Montpellier]|uniref:winged helix-turn-helix transcriptional regulator n=1 Tax=Desulfosarcina variabilis TaxID=2300 RepID=UPI003AFA0EA8
MELRRLKTLQLLEEIAEDKPISQRELSDSLQISLGLVNSFIKRLVKKGYCKVTTIPKRRVKYLLTPSGAMEKTRLTYEYIATSYQYFKSATQKVQNLYLSLQDEGHTRVVFYGAGEMANIALYAMAVTDLKLVGVVDPKRKGNQFSDFIVGDTSLLQQCNYHAILITTVDHHEAIIDEIARLGVASNKVRFF